MIKMKTFFSEIARLFGKETPKAAVVTKAEPAPPVPPAAPAVMENPPLELQLPTPPAPAASAASPTPAPVKRKKKQVKAKLDKKGIPIITDSDDLGELFQVEDAKKKKSQEDFARLFEKSQVDIYQRVMLLEKKKDPVGTKSLPPSERVKGYPAPQEELDLHGFSAAKAESATEFFIRNTRRLKIQTVRIIVGKGMHSDGKAVLPDVVEAKIIELKHRDWVLNYKWEKKDKRKSGSMIVYLTPALI
ncbi:MAG: Smr/MutS family protein [Candidatus Aminicenantes bacterium]|nr:Smr/MutS family protein [Candidatus Aminicenantes bacterium]